MKVIIILSLFVSYAFCTVTNCKPHDIFMDDEGCNMCHCSEDGLNAACTMAMCTPPVCSYTGQKEKCHIVCECKSSGQEAVCAGSAVVKEECPKGLKYYKDCRTCSCNDGIESCDRTLTVPGKCMQGDFGEENFSCLPMCKFMHDGHLCMCKEDGKTAECSKMKVSTPE